MKIIKTRFSHIFNTDYEHSLRSFNEVLDLERQLDQESHWTDHLLRISGDFKNSQEYIDNLKDLVDNDAKILKLEKQSRLSSENSSFAINSQSSQRNNLFYLTYLRNSRKN